jgi:hypothetical protein
LPCRIGGPFRELQIQQLWSGSCSKKVWDHSPMNQKFREKQRSQVECELLKPYAVAFAIRKTAQSVSFPEETGASC